MTAKEDLKALQESPMGSTESELLAAAYDVIAELEAEVPRCYLRTCMNPAACVGEYEGNDGHINFVCDEHCGHGNEDGWCEPIGLALEALRGRLSGVTKQFNEAEERIAELEAEVERLRTANTMGLHPEALDALHRAEAERDDARRMLRDAFDWASACMRVPTEVVEQWGDATASW